MGGPSRLDRSIDPSTPPMQPTALPTLFRCVLGPVGALVRFTTRNVLNGRPKVATGRDEAPGRQSMYGPSGACGWRHARRRSVRSRSSCCRASASCWRSGSIRCRSLRATGRRTRGSGNCSWPHSLRMHPCGRHAATASRRTRSPSSCCSVRRGCATNETSVGARHGQAAHAACRRPRRPDAGVRRARASFGASSAARGRRARRDVA